MPEGVQEVEQTTASSQDGIETPIDESASSLSEEPQVSMAAKEEQKIPYDRFKTVVEERNKYKELLDTYQRARGNEAEKVQTRVAERQPYQDYQDETGIPKDDVAPIIEKLVDKRLGNFSRQLDLDRAIAQNSDFFQYADVIKAKIEENPNISWNDAYKLAKFDVIHSQAREQGRQEAYKAVVEKKKATVEGAVKTKTKGQASLDQIDPLAKGPDGKFLYSRKELEEILPKV